MSCLVCLQLYSCSLIRLISISSFIYYYNINLNLFPDIVYMWGILETIGAGLIVSLINICVYIYTYIVDVCRTSQEENDDDAMVSV